MNDDPERIRGLADLESGVSPAFLGFIRRKIHRRSAASYYANFSWSMPGLILLEFINLIVHIFAVADGGKGKSK